MQSFDDAVSVLGAPDQDSFSTSVADEQDEKPPEVKRYRHFLYTQLSDTVDVVVGERPDGAVRWGLQGKLLDSQSEKTDS